MITLERLKSYLRIDSDYEDDLLEQFMEAATAYLVGAVSDYRNNYSRYPEFATKADLLTCVLAAEYYQNRDNSAHDMSYTIRSLMAQLQYFPADTEVISTEGVPTIENGDAATGMLAMFDANGNLFNSGIKLASNADIEEVLDEVGLTVKGGG